MVVSASLATRARWPLVRISISFDGSGQTFALLTIRYKTFNLNFQVKNY